MTNLLKEIISLCKRRGFVFPSSEIYGGFSSCYDFGPLGVEVKRNIKKNWWKQTVRLHKDVVGLDSGILMSPKIWKASGHLSAGFADELMECKECHKRFRVDKIDSDTCPECGGEFTEPKQFNLMMETYTGPIQNEDSKAYLRPETAQGIYINFKNVMDSRRLKLPFGIAQIGKAFRNEITPKNYIFRTREFEQMEMQWFCDPDDADMYFEYWKKQRLNWYLELGVDKDKLRFNEIEKEERAHYAKKQIDLEYKFPFGWQEIEGIHNRGDWDLSNHSKHSHQDLKYQDKEKDKEYYPYVIETSVGVERSFLAFMVDAYQKVEGGRDEKSKKKQEKVLKLHKKLAPIKVAVFPLIKKEQDLVNKAKEVYEKLKLDFSTEYDEAGSIGRRYRRQDEIGTPFCVTCDFDTLEDKSVTIRDRDTMEQERVKVKNLKEILRKKLRDNHPKYFDVQKNKTK